MVYSRMESLGPDLRRFYALGIDACRIAELIVGGRNRIDIDGVTGHLNVNIGIEDSAAASARAVMREPLLAGFRDASMLPPPADPAPPASPQ